MCNCSRSGEKNDKKKKKERKKNYCNARILFESFKNILNNIFSSGLEVRLIYN